MLTFKYLNSVWVSQPILSEPCLFALSILIRTTQSVHVPTESEPGYDAFTNFDFMFL